MSSCRRAVFFLSSSVCRNSRWCHMLSSYRIVQLLMLLKQESKLNLCIFLMESVPGGWAPWSFACICGLPSGIHCFFLLRSQLTLQVSDLKESKYRSLLLLKHKTPPKLSHDFFHAAVFNLPCFPVSGFISCLLLERSARPHLWWSAPDWWKIWPVAGYAVGSPPPWFPGAHTQPVCGCDSFRWIVSSSSIWRSF